MNRSLCALLLTVVAGAAIAQDRVYRIGYLQAATAKEQAHLTAALDQGLKELGYVEGRNLVMERRFADGEASRLPELAAELVRLKVDVIVAGGNPVAGAAKAATSTVPIVMAASSDPVGAGFAASLARPGGNITGLTDDPATERPGKRVELLKAALPKARRIALLLNPASPGAEALRQQVEAAAKELDMTVRTFEARARIDLDAAFEAMARYKAEGLVVHPDPLFFAARAQVLRLAGRHRIPAVHHAREMAEEGGLMSYGANLADQYRRAATFVDRILKGERPAELPIERHSRMELVVNMRTAASLGIPPHEALLKGADHTID